MAKEIDSAAAVAAGQKLADAILAQRVQIARRMAKPAGFLVAVGDSWFDYPFFDVLKKLEDDHGYCVASSAQAGARVEDMSTNGGQIDRLARLFEKAAAANQVPKALLLSGGGDDIAGKEFGMLLNSAFSAIEGWNEDVLQGLIEERIALAYRTLIAAVEQVAQHYIKKQLPVIVHGYDYPVPDGRGYLGGFPLPGPWLKPGFDEKKFGDLKTNVELMRLVIDRFNAMLSAMANEPLFSEVRYLDLRGTLSTDLYDGNYQKFWGNELHPTDSGFCLIADKFALELNRL